MATTYILIASTTLSASTSSVTLSSISNAYNDLVLNVSARTDRTGSTQDELAMRFNSDSSSIYSDTWFGTNGNSGTAALVGKNNGWNYARLGIANSAGTTANTFSNMEIYIPNYTTTSNKQFSRKTVSETNASTGAWMECGAGLYANATAISSINIYSANSTNLVSGSSFYLYGIKNT